MVIAVDFDGTIVEDRYPGIGMERPFAAATLRRLIERGHRLILWTVREGELLDEAVAWSEERGVEFYAVNKDFYEETKEENKHYSRKIKADVFIDDRNLGGLPDWGMIYQIIVEHKTYEQCLLERMGQPIPKKKKAWWKF